MCDFSRELPSVVIVDEEDHESLGRPNNANNANDGEHGAKAVSPKQHGRIPHRRLTLPEASRGLLLESCLRPPPSLR